VIRRLFNVMTAMSIALFAATVILWRISYRCGNLLSYTTNLKSLSIGSEEGSAGFGVISASAPNLGQQTGCNFYSCFARGQAV
jgi:hypothetical protein